MIATQIINLSESDSKILEKISKHHLLGVLVKQTEKIESNIFEKYGIDKNKWDVGASSDYKKLICIEKA